MRPGAAWRDQVPRQQAFTDAHPEVTITSGGAGSWWQAAVPDGDAMEYLTRFELCDLLDVLEERFGVPP